MFPEVRSFLIKCQWTYADHQLYRSCSASDVSSSTVFSIPSSSRQKSRLPYAFFFAVKVLSLLPSSELTMCFQRWVPHQLVFSDAVYQGLVTGCALAGPAGCAAASENDGPGDIDAKIQLLLQALYDAEKTSSGASPPMTSGQLRSEYYVVALLVALEAARGLTASARFSLCLDEHSRAVVSIHERRLSATTSTNTKPPQRLRVRATEADRAVTRLRLDTRAVGDRPAAGTYVLIASNVITRTFPSSDSCAKARYKTTLRYEGINSADPKTGFVNAVLSSKVSKVPIRNIAKWLNAPRGGLRSSGSSS